MPRKKKTKLRAITTCPKSHSYFEKWKELYGWSSFFCHNFLGRFATFHRHRWLFRFCFLPLSSVWSFIIGNWYRMACKQHTLTRKGYNNIFGNRNCISAKESFRYIFYLKFFRSFFLESWFEYRNDAIVEHHKHDYRFTLGIPWILVKINSRTVQWNQFVLDQ